MIGVQLGSAIKQNRTSILLWVWLSNQSNQSNKIELIQCNFVSNGMSWCWKLVKHVGYSHYQPLLNGNNEKWLHTECQCSKQNKTKSMLTTVTLVLPDVLLVLKGNGLSCFFKASNIGLYSQCHNDRELKITTTTTRSVIWCTAVFGTYDTKHSSFTLSWKSSSFMYKSTVILSFWSSLLLLDPGLLCFFLTSDVDWKLV